MRCRKGGLAGAAAAEAVVLLLGSGLFARAAVVAAAAACAEEEKGLAEAPLVARGVLVEGDVPRPWLALVVVVVVDDCCPCGVVPRRGVAVLVTPLLFESAAVVVLVDIIVE